MQGPAGTAAWSGVGAGCEGAILLTGLVAFVLLSAVYCNLVTALVARREQLVLKRLRTGESTHLFFFFFFF